MDRTGTIAGYGIVNHVGTQVWDRAKLLVGKLRALFLRYFLKRYIRAPRSECDDMRFRDEYRARAVEFRAKADGQPDPLFRSMFEKLAKTYSRLAELDDRGDARTKLAWPPSGS